MAGEGRIPPMTKTVDSYRYTSGIIRRLVQSWIERETYREIPWTPLARPVSECTVALLTSGGMALKSDRPFDQEGERRNAWWGDPSYRIIPRRTESADIRVYHLHINPSFAEEDVDCLLPIHRLEELSRAGKVGEVAPSHYSFVGTSSTRTSCAKRRCRRSSGICIKRRSTWPFSCPPDRSAAAPSDWRSERSRRLASRL